MPLDEIDYTAIGDTRLEADVKINEAIAKVNEIDEGLPGGDAGDSLVKSSGGDYDYIWGGPYKSTSASSNIIERGTKVFAVGEAHQFAIGNRIRFTDQANPANYMEGPATAYSAGNLTITVDMLGGSGTKTAWYVNAGGSGGLNTAPGGVVASITGGTVSAQVIVLNLTHLNGIMNCSFKLTFSGGSGSFTQIDIPIADFVPAVIGDVFGFATMNSDSSNNFVVETTATGIKLYRADGATFGIAAGIIKGFITYLY